MLSMKYLRETGCFHRVVFSIAANEGNKGVCFPPLTDAKEPWTAPEELLGSMVCACISVSKGENRSWEDLEEWRKIDRNSGCSWLPSSSTSYVKETIQLITRDDGQKK